MPPLPPPLPPGERPVAQLVGESIRLYGRRLWPSLALGILPATWAALPRLLDDTALFGFIPIFGALLLSAAYVGAILVAAEERARPLVAFVAGVVVFLPFQVLLIAFVLPAVAWLAAVGLVVPVLALERLSVLAAVRRAFALARADFVHVLGSLATLTIVLVLTLGTMTFALRDFGDQALVAASFIAWVVASPLFFLGAALLYYDQAARLESR